MASPALIQRFWTKNITVNLTLDGSEGITAMTVMLISGSATITGALTLGALGGSDALALQALTPLTLGGMSTAPLAGITIAVTGGTVQIVAIA